MHHRSIRTAATILLLTAVLAGTGCRLTDHSERDGEVTSAQVNIPVSASGPQDTANAPRFRWDDMSVDFGRVSQGSKVDHVYHFKNIGQSDLLITDVHGSCGCTVARDWPKHPVKPGEEGSISVTFDTDKRSGHQEKLVTVVANTWPASTALFLHGEVIAPAGTLPVE